MSRMEGSHAGLLRLLSLEGSPCRCGEWRFAVSSCLALCLSKYPPGHHATGEGRFCRWSRREMGERALSDLLDVRRVACWRRGRS